MTKLIKKLSVNSDEALVIHGVNIRDYIHNKKWTLVLYTETYIGTINFAIG